MPEPETSALTADVLDRLRNHVDESNDIGQLFPWIKLIPLDKVKEFVRNEIQTFGRNEYFTAMSINEILPPDVVQHVLSFTRVFFSQNSLVCKTWVELIQMNKHRLAKTRLIPKTISFAGGFFHQRLIEFVNYAEALRIEVLPDWTDDLDVFLTKGNGTGKPIMSPDFFCCILCDIPVVKASFLEQSFKERRVVDFRKHVWNYRRVTNPALFEGLDILFAVALPQCQRELRLVLTLGKANILKQQELKFHDKDSCKRDRRIMLCSEAMTAELARKVSTQYNCRVIYNRWVFDCLYVEENESPIQYRTKPIVKVLDFDLYDMTTWDDDEDEDQDANGR